MRRPLLLALPLLLTACAAPREAAPVLTPPVEQVPDYSPVGAWAFTMGSGGNEAQGTLRIDPDGGGRIEIPMQGIASNVSEGALRFDAEGFTWSGRLSAGILGPVQYTMTGAVEGDQMTAENAVPGVGTFALSGQRRE
jgi:hypothetical protein